MWPIWRCGTQLLKICMSNCDLRTLGTIWREVRGPHRSSEKPFKTINICERFEYTIRLFKRKKSQSPFWECKWPLIWKKKLESLLPKEALCQVGKIDMVILEKIYKFSLFLYCLLWKKGTTLYLNRLESPFPKKSLWQVCLNMTHAFSRIRFLNFVNIFHVY